MSATSPTVHGTTEPGFEAVRDAFAENLAKRRELGAACSVVHQGRTVVELWGGHVRRGGRTWERDTLVLIYSVTKGVAAAALARLHTEGHLDYDAPVAAYWPEFGAAGKRDITVRCLLAHQAGLAGLDLRLRHEDLADLDALAKVLARQRPRSTPGARHAYHAISLGFYQSELMRRLDPQGRTLGRYVEEELARPVGGDLHVGLPESVAPERVAPIEPLNPLRLFLHPRAFSPRFALALAWPWSSTARSIRNPKLRGPADLDAAPWRSVELASANGYATARALASLYGSLATDGAALGIGADTLALLRAPAELPPSGEWDTVFKRRTAFALGFMKPSSDFRFGASPAAFGAPGVGGSFAYADPDRALGYAYVTNRLGFNVFDDPREKALRQACEACVDALAGAPA
ncbi:MAG: serine hydrolase domain-containing protein [Planctomycetota bacterium]|nr:serine hydrolase domain-containing protein [Planctomycetota bacterium]